MTDRTQPTRPRHGTGQGSCAAPVRVVTRYYRGDCLPHLYLLDEIDDPAVDYLVPPGHGGLYPDRHPRVELDEHAGPMPGRLADACPRCSQWARENEHRVVLRGEVLS